MRILVLTSQGSGVGYHRLMLPIYYLEKTYAFFTDTLTDEVLEENFDILLFNRFIAGTNLETLLEKRKKYGFKMICDIDDYWILDRSHILESVYPTQEIINHIREADLVTCTNEKLWNEIRPINSNVAILPNALPYGNDQFTDVREYTDKVKFVYTGSITHEEDIKLVQFPFKKVASDSSLRSKIHFQLCGFDDSGEGSAAIWHRMISNFTCGLKLGDTRRFLPVTEYMNFYNDADCSIVPLRATKFNSMKSNLKLLEAASKKIPVIGSNVEPYLNSPMIQVNQQGDWYKEIKKVTEDAIYRQDKGLELFEWAVANFSLFKVNEKRKQLYQSMNGS
jgi:glycosyltransferase involved in cell wall biosynthesis